jgi:hypothetical protein
MARLFIGARELAFISDITKELTKDVSGQKIYYYRISAERTHTHSVYDEAVAKVFDPPIEIECLVGQPEYSTASTTFSVEMTSTIEAFVQRRDLLDKGIEVTVGDFFTYGEVLYEIAKVEPMRSIFGQVEHKDGVKLTGTYARQGQLSVKPHGPTEEGRSDADAVQDEFVQQRGQAENRLGPTADERALIENGTLDPPITGAKEVSRRAGTRTPTFYGED